jgi:hypothetical protein
MRTIQQLEKKTNRRIAAPAKRTARRGTTWIWRFTFCNTYFAKNKKAKIIHHTEKMPNAKQAEVFWEPTHPYVIDVFGQ